MSEKTVSMTIKELFPEIPCIKGERITLKKVDLADAPKLQELVDSPNVQRYLPTFLYEQKYEDKEYVIRHLYDECLEESLILGVYLDGAFCGLAEMYGYRPEIHKISIGCRLLERYWRHSVATEAMKLIVDYLHEEKEIEIITTSTMVQNKGSAGVMRKLGFDLVVHAAEEDWGYPSPTLADKWII